MPVVGAKERDPAQGKTRLSNATDHRTTFLTGIDSRVRFSPHTLVFASPVLCCYEREQPVECRESNTWGFRDPRLWRGGGGAPGRRSYSRACDPPRGRPGRGRSRNTGRGCHCPDPASPLPLVTERGERNTQPVGKISQEKGCGTVCALDVFQEKKALLVQAYRSREQWCSFACTSVSPTGEFVLDSEKQEQFWVGQLPKPSHWL